MQGAWFLDLLDCLKSVSNMTIPELKASMHDLHPIDWSKTNAKPPQNSEQYDYWQFRINKATLRNNKVYGYQFLKYIRKSNVKSEQNRAKYNIPA